MNQFHLLGRLRVDGLEHHGALVVVRCLQSDVYCSCNPLPEFHLLKRCAHMRVFHFRPDKHEQFYRHLRGVDDFGPFLHEIHDQH